MLAPERPTFLFSRRIQTRRLAWLMPLLENFRILPLACAVHFGESTPRSTRCCGRLEPGGFQSHESMPSNKPIHATCEDARA